MRPGIVEYRQADGRRINLVAEGRLVNLAAPTSMGHPAEVMDQTFAMQFMAALDLVQRHGELPAGVQPVPDRLDREVAELKLHTLGITIDDVTPDQQAYGDAWQSDAILR